MDITTKYKDEEVIVDVLLQDSAGNPIASPESQTVTIVISLTAGGAALNNTGYAMALADSGTARFRRVLTPADLAAVDEGKDYFYNIWSKAGTTPPVLRAKGKINLIPSISLP